MGNQHSNQLNLKQWNKKIKQKSRINLSSLSNGGKAKVNERGSAFLCHSNGSLIANVQFRCNFCSTVKRSAFAIKSHYGKRHHFFESAEQLSEVEPKSDFFSIEAAGSDRSRASNCTLFIQDNDLIIRCSTLAYGVMKFDENGDQVDNQRSDQLESDLRLKRINELSKLRQELTKLNAFSRLVESAEKEQGPVRGESIRIRKFDDDLNDADLANEDQLNNNYSKFAKNKDRKIPNSASDETNSSTSSLCQSDGERAQIDEHLFGLNDLAKEVEQISETSSIDTTFGLDARCCVCDSKNYVVCIQRRLGKQICANCFRFFRHFLSDPVVYGCEQLGKCDLSKPIKPTSSHASHSPRKTTTTGTAAKHVVKQQQLGIFKSKSNTLQSTPKTRRPLQQKELSFYSIASYSNNNSLNDQSKSMTLNLPASKNYSYKERNLSPNHSSWTSPSPTQSNVSFALKANGELDYNSNLAISNGGSAPAKARCNACWIKKCITVYYDISFDDKIMKILQDFRPIQLTNLVEENKSTTGYHLNQQKSSTQLNHQQFNQSSNGAVNGTLTKQKRYYTNNKFKSKSVSRLYYNNNNNSEKNGPAKGKTAVVDQSAANGKGLSNGLAKSVAHPADGKNQSFNGSTNDSNCSSSINDSSNNSNNELNEFNNASDTNEKTKTPTTANGSKTSKPLSHIPTPIKNTKSNGKLNGNTRSDSTSSNTSSSTVNLATNTTKTGLAKGRMSNTITLNNLPFKSNAFNAMSNNKPNVSKHLTILPNASNVLSSSVSANDATVTSEEEKGQNKEESSSIESAKCHQPANQTNGDKNVSDLNGQANDPEHSLEEENVTKSASVCLIFNEPNDLESQQNVNTIEVVSDTDKAAKAKTDSNFFKLSSDNNLNLLFTNIHTMPERV